MAEILHQLRLVVYPIIYRALYIQGGCSGFCPSTAVCYYQYSVQTYRYFSWGYHLDGIFYKESPKESLAKNHWGDVLTCQGSRIETEKHGCFFFCGERLGMFFCFVVSDVRSRRKLFWCFLFLLFQILDAGFRKGEYTLQGTNISPKNGILKMIFLFPRWDMLIPWRVFVSYIDQPST